MRAFAITLSRCGIPLMLAATLAACSSGPSTDRQVSADPNVQMGRAALAGGAPALALNAGANVLKEKPRDYGYQESLSPQQRELATECTYGRHLVRNSQMGVVHDLCSPV